MDAQENLAQKAFNDAYITSREICEMLGITRMLLFYHRKQGKLPDAIEVYGGQATLWDREAVQPHLTQLQNEINQRRGIEK